MSSVLTFLILRILGIFIYILMKCVKNNMRLNKSKMFCQLQSRTTFYILKEIIYLFLLLANTAEGIHNGSGNEIKVIFVLLLILF